MKIAYRPEIRLPAFACALLLLTSSFTYAIDAEAIASRLQELDTELRGKSATAEEVLKTTYLSVSKKAELTDADLAMFAQIPKLERIDLSTAKLLTAEGLRSLQSASNLISVTLTFVETGDAGIDALAEIKTLKEIGLDGYKGMTVASAPKLAALPNLQKIGLGSTGIGDDFLTPFAGHPALRDLSVRTNNNITDVGIAIAGSIPNLTDLNVSDTAFEGATLPQLAEGGKLERFTARSTKLTDANATSGLPLLTSLRWLFIWKNDIGDDTAAAIAGMKSLEVLYLDDTKVTDAGLKTMAAMPAMNNLWLSNTAITDDGLMALRMENLESLQLNETAVTDAGIAALAKLPKVRSISARKTAITDEGIAAAIAIAGEDRKMRISH